METDTGGEEGALFKYLIWELNAHELHPLPFSTVRTDIQLADFVELIHSWPPFRLPRV